MTAAGRSGAGEALGDSMRDDALQAVLRENRRIEEGRHIRLAGHRGLGLGGEASEKRIDAGQGDELGRPAVIRHGCRSVSLAAFTIPVARGNRARPA